MALISRKGIRKLFSEKGIKIGNNEAKRFVVSEEIRIRSGVEKAVRGAKISGRKVVREEDFE